MTPVRRHLASKWRSPAAAALAMALGVMVVRLGGVIALIAPAMLGVLLLMVLVLRLTRGTDEAAYRRILWWTMVAFAAHLIFGLIATNLSRDIRFYLGTDSFNYDQTAQLIVRHWKTGMPFPFVPTGKEGFYYLLSGVYWIFGTSTAAGLAINATLAAGLVPVMTDITHRLFGAAAARYAGPLVVVLPGLFLWTSQLMREAGMLFLLAVALSAAVRLTEHLSIGALLILTGALILAFTFRAPVALIVAGGLLAGIGVGHKELVSGLGTGISTLIVVVAVMLASGLGYSGYQSAVSVNLKDANVVRKSLTYSAGTAYAPEVDISTTGSALRYLPRGVVSFLFGPFPWQVHGARQLPFVPDMVAWWMLLPSLWMGLRTAGRRIGRRQLLIFFPAVGIILFMGLALGNFGTVVRERLQVLVLVVPLIALGLAERAARRRGGTEPPVVDPAKVAGHV